MPTYERFEDLPVWQEAIRLAEEVEDFLDAVGKPLSWYLTRYCGPWRQTRSCGCRTRKT